MQVLHVQTSRTLHLEYGAHCRWGLFPLQFAGRLLGIGYLPDFNRLIISIVTLTISDTGYCDAG